MAKSRMFTHDLTVTHDRDPMTLTLADVPVDSSVDVTASSTDLVEAWAEVLSRMPADLYAGLKAAMQRVEPS